MRRITFTLILLSILAAQCAKRQAAPATGPLTIEACATTNAAFAADILPILATNCATSGCHDATTHAAGITLSNHAGASIAADFPAFLGAIKHSPDFSNMPQGGSQLPRSKIDQIECWVLNGAQDN